MMKIPLRDTISTVLATTFLFMAAGHIDAQKRSTEPEYLFHGPVKTIIITKTDYSDPKKELKTVFEYNKNGRKIKEISPYQSSTEYYYSNEKNTEPILHKWYRTDASNEQKISVEERNTADKILLKGDIEAGKWDYYYIYDYDKNLDAIRWFSDGEIYNRETLEPINLEKYTIPGGFVPFEWDKTLSTGKISKKTTFSDNDYSHTISFEYVQKGKPDNKIIFYYNGDDVNDPGKGSWHQYQGDRLLEERYVYNQSELSDFGHRYMYDSEGKRTADYYGYFSKMPDVFMQRTLYKYNDKGDCIKEIKDAENAKTYTIKKSYTYDDQGNWISQKELYEDGSGGLIKRIFTYYQPNDTPLKNTLSLAEYNEYVEQLRSYKPTAEALYKNYFAAKKQKEDQPGKVVEYQKLRSAKWQDFLPEGQKLDSVVTGDLNKDGLEDAVIVYEAEKLLKHERNEKRILRILLKQQDGKYELAAESSGAVAGENMNNVFFTGIEIVKGILIVSHDFLRGGSTHKYRYQNGGFYLIGAESHTGNAAEYSSVDYNLSTGKYVSVYENEDQLPELPKSYKKEGVKKISPLPNIETFELFSLEVEGGVL
ncbi:hypothetical protein [Chryseobacterium sp. SIMBA_029]|uniref:hypothetical protein n=2 Tax=Bacteria TaxID=2 RepID=UPI00397B813E